MDIGDFTLCLPSRDVDRSRQCYEVLGFDATGGEPGQSVFLKNGDLSLSFFTFLTQPLLNFRGGDVFDLHRRISAGASSFSGVPERYAKAKYDASADGECWTTHDVDGNELLFDTNDNERDKAARVAAILRDTRRQLRAVGADDACVAALETHVIDRFG